MRVPFSDNNRHPFSPSRRPTILTRKGIRVYIDCIETAPTDIDHFSRSAGVDPRVFCLKIGDEIAKKFGGLHLGDKLDELNTFIEPVQIEFDSVIFQIKVELVLLTEDSSCFLKVVAVK